MTLVRAWRRAMLCGLLVGAFVGAPACAGIEDRRAERAREQAEELSVLARQAEQWGEDLLSQVPGEPIADELDPASGPRLSNDLGGPSTEYYVWTRHLDLAADSELLARDLAEQLAPWLEQEGWEQIRQGVYPVEPDRVRRDYAREKYHLVVEARSEPGPVREILALLIVTPATVGLREDPLW